MHILFIGYGKTSQRVAKQLFEQGHHISTISRSIKTDTYGQHNIQNIHTLDLSQFAPIDVVYILLAPSESSVEAYQQTYVDSIEPIRHALQSHPVKRLVVVSSTRVYGENAGEIIDDATAIKPSDAQGQILREMELLWQKHYPSECVIVRPSGIYGSSVARLKRMAEQTQHYPHIHYSNRIHIADLARFLAHLSEHTSAYSSYIVTNNDPLPLHEVLQWFQQQLKLPKLLVDSNRVTGKRIYATHVQEIGFEWMHPNCFNDYAEYLNFDLDHTKADSL